MSLSWGSPTSLARSRYCASLVRPLLTLSTAHFRVASEMQINTRQIYFSKLGKVAFKHEEKKQLPPMLQIETCPSSHLNSFRGVWNWKVADFGAAFKWTGSEKQHYLWVSLCWWPLWKIQTLFRFEKMPITGAEGRRSKTGWSHGTSKQNSAFSFNF